MNEKEYRERRWRMARSDIFKIAIAFPTNNFFVTVLLYANVVLNFKHQAE